MLMLCYFYRYNKVQVQRPMGFGLGGDKLHVFPCGYAIHELLIYLLLGGVVFGIFESGSVCLAFFSGLTSTTNDYAFAFVSLASLGILVSGERKMDGWVGIGNGYMRFSFFGLVVIFQLVS
ncbi:hypothetical protein V8F06_003798, partial [Rhypophila decipiens]